MTAERLDALGIHFDKSIVQTGSQSRAGYRGEQWPLLRLGKSCGSPHVVRYPLWPPAQSPVSNGAGTTLPLCMKSGQTHPGHSLQTAFTTCVFAVFQLPRGELSALAAALPLSPGSLGCTACWSMAGACGSSGTWEEATTSCLDVMCLTPRCLLGSFRHTAHSSLAEGRSKNRI